MDDDNLSSQRCDVVRTGEVMAAEIVNTFLVIGFMLAIMQVMAAILYGEMILLCAVCLWPEMFQKDW